MWVHGYVATMKPSRSRDDLKPRAPAAVPLACGMRRVVIVDGVGSGAHRWGDALGGLGSLEVVASLEAARADALGAGDILVVDVAAPERSSLASMERSRPAASSPLRVLATDHHALPSVFQARLDESFRAIVPRGAEGTRVREVLDELLGETTREPPCDGTEDWASLPELLRETISAAVRVPGLCIRSYRPKAARFEVQLVFPASREFDAFHCALPQRWGWPARVGRDEPSRKRRPLANHRSIERFGRVERDQEIYVRPLRGSADAAYLALLPWSKDERVTLALGVWLEDDENIHDSRHERREAVLGEAFAQAVREVGQFTPPSQDDAKEGVRHLLEYDWVVTENYAGPDRRSQDTSVLGRYMFVGRRKTVAKNFRERLGGFVDGVPAWIGAYFVAYVALALIDTLCTWRFVGSGAVTEMNPLLAPLIEHNGWLFLVTKHVCALAAFAIIARFHLFERGRLVLRVSVAAYALLDAYWATLLLSDRL